MLEMFSGMEIMLILLVLLLAYANYELYRYIVDFKKAVSLLKTFKGILKESIEGEANSAIKFTDTIVQVLKNNSIILDEETKKTLAKEYEEMFNHNIMAVTFSGEEISSEEFGIYISNWSLANKEVIKYLGLEHLEESALRVKKKAQEMNNPKQLTT